MLSLEGSCCVASSSVAAGVVCGLMGSFCGAGRETRFPRLWGGGLGHGNFSLSVFLARDGCHRKPGVLVCVHAC